MCVFTPPLPITNTSTDSILAMTSMLTQNLSSHKDLLKQRTEQIDRLNEQIREFSTMQKADLERLQEMQARIRLRGERQAKIANLRRVLQEKTAVLSPAQWHKRAELGEADAALVSEELNYALSSLNHTGTLAPGSLPPPSALNASMHAYSTNNRHLQAQADELRSRSLEVEGLYRRVVSLCTGVPEDKVDEALPSLVAAIESEKGVIEGEGDVGRVRDFLRRVDGGPGSQV